MDFVWFCYKHAPDKSLYFNASLSSPRALRGSLSAQLGALVPLQCAKSCSKSSIRGATWKLQCDCLGCQDQSSENRQAKEGTRRALGYIGFVCVFLKIFHRPSGGEVKDGRSLTP